MDFDICWIYFLASHIMYMFNGLFCTENIVFPLAYDSRKWQEGLLDQTHQGRGELVEEDAASPARAVYTSPISSPAVYMQQTDAGSAQMHSNGSITAI